MCLSVCECTGDDGVSPLVSVSVCPSVCECTGDDGECDCECVCECV